MGQVQRWFMVLWSGERWVRNIMVSAVSGYMGTGSTYRQATT